MSDISSYRDIEFLVRTFYDKVKNDNVLGNIFEEIIGDKWEDHIVRMSIYWNALILEKKHHCEKEFQKYAKLPIGKKYFERWTLLFFETVNANFDGENADEAKLIAIKIALYFEPQYRQDINLLA